MKNQREGKEIVITGAAFGIGRSTALELAKASAGVVVANIIDGKEVVAAIVKDDGKASFVKCYVSFEADVKNLIDRTIALYGRLDYAINNAGIEGVAGNIIVGKEQDWDHTIDVNLKSVWL